MLHPDSGRHDSARNPESALEEARGLAEAISLEVVMAESLRVAKRRPGTLFGKGQLERIAHEVALAEIGLVVVNAALTPVQQRNLEKTLHCKVIDRTGLILEIFGERARTREGMLQVELAALSYQRSRLVRSWTHLERQRGALGFVGGPGESQLELDRRLITERITRIKKELGQVVRTRALHRQARKRVPYPVVALVGYTNAGKSTLFNLLTKASVVAEDMLFATLDPTMRKVELPGAGGGAGGGTEIILSDTVGFVSDLPTQLVAAFRATLEEVTEADVVVHVRDISHPDSAAQAGDVKGVMRDLGLGALVDSEADQPVANQDGGPSGVGDPGVGHPGGAGAARNKRAKSEPLEHNAIPGGMIEALNKIDLLEPETRATLAEQSQRNPLSVPISALTGEGTEALMRLVAERLATRDMISELAVPLSDGAAMAWLYSHGQVLERHDDDAFAHLLVRLNAADRARYGNRFGDTAATAS